MKSGFMQTYSADLGESLRENRQLPTRIELGTEPLQRVDRRLVELATRSDSDLNAQIHTKLLRSTMLTVNVSNSGVLSASVGQRFGLTSRYFSRRASVYALR